MASALMRAGPAPRNFNSRNQPAGACFICDNLFLYLRRGYNLEGSGTLQKVKKPLLIDRRTMMVSALAIAASSAPARSMAVGTRPNAQRLWYRQPAGAWTEALPIGNGRLGTMVFGRVGQER